MKILSRILAFLSPFGFKKWCSHGVLKAIENGYECVECGKAFQYSERQRAHMEGKRK